MAGRHEADLVIVGGGPAGLNAAIYAAYEGIETLVVDGKGRFGGQAGQALKIENYGGFVGGVSGYELTSLFLDQGRSLGADYRAPFQVEDIEILDGGFKLRDDTEEIVGRAVLLACGVVYKRHNAKNLSVYLNRGINYGSPDRNMIYENKQLVVVGGANSAGQAALTLSGMTGCEVHILIRNKDMRAKMSAKLADEIEATPNVTVHTKTEITNAHGDNGHLSALTIMHEGENEHDLPADEVFLLIGANPRTMWLPERVARDGLGFICAGRQLDDEIRKRFEEGCGRAPMDRETSVPGLFTAGDIRSNTQKRVAVAAGDAAVAIPEIFQHLNK